MEKNSLKKEHTKTQMRATYSHMYIFQYQFHLLFLLKKILYFFFINVKKSVENRMFIRKCLVSYLNFKINIWVLTII